MGYFLGDGIYPEWCNFVRPIHDVPVGPQNAYKKAQEGTRKNIERLFGVLQGRFRILLWESELWCVEDVMLVSELFVIFAQCPRQNAPIRSIGC